jgi:DNA polymerase III subunit epsilon
MPRFLAIDFETAHYAQDSACALGAVLADESGILNRHYWLIRPPRPSFVFTYIHGITWEHVADQPPFAAIWPDLRPIMASVDFIAAHNASFDRGVLQACCRAARLHAPRKPYVCTVVLARKAWGIRPTKLPDVCSALDIPLDHHQALADAEACARIVLRAMSEQHAPERPDLSRFQAAYPRLHPAQQNASTSSITNNHFPIPNNQ